MVDARIIGMKCPVCGVKLKLVPEYDAVQCPKCQRYYETYADIETTAANKHLYN